MSVELPSASDSQPAPQLPRNMVWLLIAAAILVAWVAVTLVTWPKGQPTNTWWFWARLLAVPVLIGLFAYGLRLLYHEQEFFRLEAQQKVLAYNRSRAIQFASQPLALVDAAYLCALGGHAASQVAKGACVLQARRHPQQNAAIRHTSLESAGSVPLLERYRDCFAHLLASLQDSLARLPAKARLQVVLVLPDDAADERTLAVWKLCWQASGLVKRHVALLTPELGVMMVDQWLDVRGGPELEKIALVVAVQLYAIPLPNSAEAAVGLLLGWPAETNRFQMKARGLLHRPLEIKHDTSAALSRTLLWGNAKASEVEHLWHAGLRPSDQAALMQASSVLSLAFSEAEGLGGIHDIDAAIGDAGVAAGWLTIALAMEYATQTQVPQLVASRQQTLRTVVIQPEPTAPQGEFSG